MRLGDLDHVVRIEPKRFGKGQQRVDAGVVDLAALVAANGGVSDPSLASEGGLREPALLPQHPQAIARQLSEVHSHEPIVRERSARFRAISLMVCRSVE